jgi:hypothetical protein
MLATAAAGALLAVARRPAPAPVEAPPKPPARIVPQRLPLRDLYDDLACEAIDRWHDRGLLDVELRTVEALDRARGLLALSRRGGRLCDRRGAC